LLTATTNKGGIWEFFQADHVPARFTPSSAGDSATEPDQSDEKPTENLF
jgi:penicillin-binding protein 1A